MQQHNIKRNTKRKKHRVVGRGGKHAKTSGRGTKGQKARSGRKLRPEIRDIIKKLPKLRGRGKNSLKKYQATLTPISIETLVEVFNSGDTVSAKTLSEKKVIIAKNGRLPRVKILAKGDINKKLEIVGLVVSAGAKAKIEEAGGKIS